MDKEHIYIISHKPYKLTDKIDKKLYRDMVVGADLGNKGNSKALYDNTGDNISCKNKSFCELTGLYWIYKNTTDDIIGLVHYRRFFVYHNHIINRSEIDQILKNYDVILPERDPFIFLGYDADQFFGLAHDPLIWTLCRDVIDKLYPEYVSDFDWFSKQSTGYSYNMFVSHSRVVKDYSDWLFNILFELEKKVDLSQYDSYNQRMFGFLSERLFNVWLHHQNLKIKEVTVKFMERQPITVKIPALVNKLRAHRRLNKKISGKG